MTDDRHPPHDMFPRLQLNEFWSGGLGLTLVTVCVVILIFIIFPLRGAGLAGRVFLDILMVVLMGFGAFAVNQSRAATVCMIAIFLASGVVLTTSRLHPAAHLAQLGSILSTVALLLYVRIVLLVMFRRGPVTWHRIQGGVCAYLLVGMAWGSAFEFVERLSPGAFHFVSPPMDMDQLTWKLTYFSFSTLTTVGFGDVAPVLPLARSLAIAEAVVGQLFPVILMGALVAMAMQPRAKS
jgi:hypothetical protein